MQISITGKQINIGDSLRTHVEDNLDSTVHKYFDSALQGNVAFSREGPGIQVDISVHAGRGILLKSGASGQDPYHAFDSAVERMAKQLRRYKRRLTDHKGGKKLEESEPAQLSVLAPSQEDEEPEEENAAPAVIAEMAADIPSCSVSGAVMRLDLADAPALLFRNSAHGGLNLVYRRKDGNIGWIDPAQTKKNAS